LGSPATGLPGSQRGFEPDSHVFFAILAAGPPPCHEKSPQEFGLTGSGVRPPDTDSSIPWHAPVEHAAWSRIAYRPVSLFLLACIVPGVRQDHSSRCTPVDEH